MPRNSTSENSGSGPAFGTFIVSSSLEKPGPDTRKFIRSYVMRGKNKRRPRPRLAESSGDQMWVAMSPQAFYDQFSLLGLEYGLTPHVKRLIHQAFTVVKPAASSVQTLLVGNAPDDLFCVRTLLQHPAMIHAVIFTTQAFYERSLGLGYGTTARLHLSKTLNYLQNSLDSKSDATSDDTIVVVTSLAMAAILLGELETAGKHMDGLARMVELRGGFKALGKGGIMEHKARSIDLGLAIGMGCETRFPQAPAWNSGVTRRNFSAKFPELNTIAHYPFDPRLAGIWADLWDFSRAADAAVASGTRISARSFTNISESVPHRLLGLCYDSLSFNELLRLSMLAYVKTILVRTKGVGQGMTFLADRLKSAILFQLSSADPEQLPFLSWALFMAAISIYEGLGEGWIQMNLVNTMSSLGLATWSEARGALGLFLWTDVFHDTDGRQLFEECFRETPAEVDF